MSLSPLSALSTNQQLHINVVSSISDFTSIVPSDEIEHSIADRAKTRERIQAHKKKPVILDDFLELSSEDDIENSTKSSAQSSKLKANAKIAEKPIPSVIANSHNHSEQPRQRPRPRPRPIIKGARAKLGSDSLPPHQYPFAQDSFVSHILGIGTPETSTHLSNHGRPGLPIATFQRNTNHVGISMSSQLPPSDPPSSTIGNDALPPIEILLDGESEPEGDRHLSSPTSLFSDTSSRIKVKSKKRKRALDINNGYEIDQLVASSPCPFEATSHFDLPALDTCPHGPEPPPTFFAGSSSSAGRHDGQRDRSEPQAEIIDLTDLPPTMDAKSSISNKNKRSKTETEINSIVEGGGEEEGSDFKPSGRKTTKKRKSKGKEPPKGKDNKPKEKKGRTRKKKDQLESVVSQPKGKTGKTRTMEDQIEKEVFKSREIIDDSDEDGDPLLLEGDTRVEGESLSSTKVNVTSPKFSDQKQGGLSSGGGKSSESNLRASVSAESKEKARLQSRKRKSIVESDDEEPENEIQGDCIIVKRRKSNSGIPVSDKELERGRVDEEENQDTVPFVTIDQESIRVSSVSKDTEPEDEVETTAKSSSWLKEDEGRPANANAQKVGNVL